MSLGIMASSVMVATGPVGYDGEVLADSPVAYWPLNEGSGLPQDLSGNGNHATTYYGGAANSWVSDDTLGTGTVVDTSNGYGWAIPPSISQSAYTLEVWAKYTSQWLTRTGYMLSDLSVASGGSGAALYASAGQTTRPARSRHGTSAIAAGTMAVNKWCHVVATWDGATVRTYLNGVAGATLNTSAAPGGSDNESRLGWVGGTTTMPNNTWPGRLARAAWYDHALTPGRIAAHYTAGTP